MRALATLVAATSLGLAAACTVVDGAEPSIDDYATWYRVDNTGAIPGHGDSYRIIYVNEQARRFSGIGRYPLCSTMVKEIRTLNDDGSPGSLRYLAIMRKVSLAREGACPSGDPDDRFRVPDDVPLHDGWLFTLADSIDDDERIYPGCFSTCHVQAPFDGAWLDYGR
jgi:hypothetical protein